MSSAERRVQITCLYDMDIPRPENFNETYLYEGELSSPYAPGGPPDAVADMSTQNSWSVTLPPSSDQASP